MSSDDSHMEPDPQQPERRVAREDLSNSDQISLMNTLIDNALERQKKSFVEHIDLKLGAAHKQPTTADDFEFRQEGNKIQYKFNSQRSEKLSEVLRLLRSESTEVGVFLGDIFSLKGVSDIIF